jgi:hypothetical protein
VADTGSQAEVATRTQGEPIQAEGAPTLAEAHTDIATPTVATLAVATLAVATVVAAITGAAAITVEEAIMAVAATVITVPDLGWASDSTAHRTPMDMATRLAIAARQATMISTVIGFLPGAPRILTKPSGWPLRHWYRVPMSG